MNPEFMDVVKNATNEVLVWVGFGTLIGLAAKALMPGRDPGGTVATLMMGIAGCIIGCGVLLFFVDSARVEPVSLLGFAAGTVGAFLLLFFYRLLAGSLFVEAETHDHWAHRWRRRRRRNVIARDI